MVAHLHGAHTTEDSDNFAEAWYLPNAANIPASIRYRTGTFYDYFKEKYGFDWEPGTATFIVGSVCRALGVAERE